MKSDTKIYNKFCLQSLILITNNVNTNTSIMSLSWNINHSLGCIFNLMTYTALGTNHICKIISVRSKYYIYNP